MYSSWHFIRLLLILPAVCLLIGCQSTRELSSSAFYNYDHAAPLHATIQAREGNSGTVYDIEYTSTHHQRVNGILSLPKQSDKPVPVIILVHGLGDSKEVDYIAAGEEFLKQADYAVLRIDLYNHGSRKAADFDFSMEGSTRYRSREIITQSVFDLRRAIDFIETCEKLDHDRIGYLGISLGGIIGTIFTGVDDRVDVPVIILAGGRFNLMFGMGALTKEIKNYLSIMDPIHFVDQISPRPLLMINAENDEVVAPITSRFLFDKAGDPKKIIWYPASHRTIPIDKTYAESISWFRKYL